MADVTEKFLRYVAVDTQSEDEQEAFPVQGKTEKSRKNAERRTGSSGCFRCPDG